jgi:anti-sigma regulatory factor (Ser/Thr protein kinase)
MPARAQVSIPVREEGEVGTARRRAVQMASNAGLDEVKAGNVAIIASEAATNLVKHGSGGEVLLRELVCALEIVAIDKGKGMRDVSACLADGFSSAGTAGNGLGAIRRLSTLFDIYSQRDLGTAMLARVDAAESPEKKSRMKFGVVCRPKHGELVSGDGWCEKETGAESWILAVDGFRHGPEAHEAAMEAVRMFEDTHGARTTTDCVEALHGAMRKTRGAAVAVVKVDHLRHELGFTGVGNIAASIVGNGPSRSLVSHNGILGHEVRRIQEFTYPWTKGSRLVMNSDGLATWHLEKYAGLMQRHPSIVASVLYRDFWRQRDDVTVLVAQEAE